MKLEEEARDKHTHGRNADQWRAHTSIKTPPKPIARNTLANHINCRRVDALFGGLQAHLDEIEWMADNDGADTTKATSGKGAKLREARGGGGFGFGFDLVFGFGQFGKLVVEGRGDFVLEGLVDCGGWVVFGRGHGWRAEMWPCGRLSAVVFIGDELARSA